MNDQNWVRKPLAPPPHIAYAHKLGRGMLTFAQIEELVKPINTFYVQSKQNKSYLAQHQARAEMNRIFGYGNWSSLVQSMTLMYEERIEPGHPSFPRTGKAPVYWISGYEAHVLIEVRDLWGMPVTSFSEYHAEENAPQPNRGEARALAMTSVESYALRRALIGLGDRLGLGLYNGGSTAPHGQYTVQLDPGQLFEWQPAGGGQPAVPAPAMPTHETIQAEPVISDDGTNPQWQDPSEQQPVQQPIQPGGMQEFHQSQQALQASREQARAAAAQPAIDPNMQARLQAGFKTDGA